MKGLRLFLFAGLLFPGSTFASPDKTPDLPISCSEILVSDQTAAPEILDLRPAYVGEVSTVDSSLGPLSFGVVNVDYPGVADTISAILVRSISDAKESRGRGGHIPDHLVDDVIQQYISPEKVKTLWRPYGHRFALMDAQGQIIGTLLLAIDKHTILYWNRWQNNLSDLDFVGVKPEGFHQMMNLSVRHELRRAHLASVMMDGITQHFRHLFNGRGIWMRADPPWHDKLAGLGFQHDPSMDSFLPPESEKTLGLAHVEYNAQFTCDCVYPAPGRPDRLLRRPGRYSFDKIQYFSFTREFEPRRRLIENSNVLTEELKNRAETAVVDMLVIGSGPVGTAFAQKWRELNPQKNLLVVDRDLAGFAMAGHGKLYPMSPAVGASSYPRDVENAMLAAQIELPLMITEVAAADEGNLIRFENGTSVVAKKVVVATGLGEVNTDTLALTAKTQWQSRQDIYDFTSFARGLQSEVLTGESWIGSEQTVAILGGGAAAHEALRQLAQYGAPKKVLWIGENVNAARAPASLPVDVENLKVHRVTYHPEFKLFRIHTVDARGAPRQFDADRVVMNFGFRRGLIPALADIPVEDLNYVGAAAFTKTTPALVDMIAQAEVLAAELSDETSAETRRYSDFTTTPEKK